MKKLIATFFALALMLVVGVHEARALEAAHLYSGYYAGGSNVTLSWTQVPGATYQVLYGPVGNPQAHGAALGTDTSYTVGALFQNTNYVFSIKSVRDGDVSAVSNSVTVYVGSYGRPTVQQAAAPAPVGAEVDGRVVTPAVSYNQAADTMRSDAAPNDPYISSGKYGYGLQNLRTTRGSQSGEITLHWNDAPVANAGGYNIVYTDQPGVEKWGALNIPGESRSFTVRGLTPGVRYWFWVSNERTGQPPWVSDIAR